MSRDPTIITVSYRSVSVQSGCVFPRSACTSSASHSKATALELPRTSNCLQGKTQTLCPFYPGLFINWLGFTAFTSPVSLRGCCFLCWIQTSQDSAPLGLVGPSPQLPHYHFCSFFMTETRYHFLGEDGHSYFLPSHETQPLK